MKTSAGMTSINRCFIAYQMPGRNPAKNIHHQTSISGKVKMRRRLPPNCQGKGARRRWRAPTTAANVKPDVVCISKSDSTPDPWPRATSLLNC